MEVEKRERPIARLHFLRAARTWANGILFIVLRPAREVGGRLSEVAVDGDVVECDGASRCADARDQNVAGMLAAVVGVVATPHWLL